MDRGTFSPKVTARATSLAKAAFADSSVTEESIEIVPRYEHDDPELWRIARRSGLVATKNTRDSPFTAMGLRESVDCATYEEPHCRRFIVARSRFVRAVGLDPGWDGLGEIRNVFIRTEVVSEPIGPFAAAMASAGILSCSNGVRTIPWRGAKTHATVLISFGFTDVPIDHDAAIMAALKADSPSREIDCPFTRDRTEDNIGLTDNVH